MCNKDIPESAVIKQLLIENGKLKSEIAYLESELESRNKAIAAFKDWQTRLAAYKYKYWLDKGVELLRERPSEELLHQLRSVLALHTTYGKLIRRIDVILKRFDKIAERGLLEAEIKRIEEKEVIC